MPTDENEMHYEESITLYTKRDEQKLREMVLKIGQPALSEVTASYYTTDARGSTHFNFDLDRIMRLLKKGAYCFWGVGLDQDKQEGYTLAIDQMNRRVTSIDIDVLLTEKNEEAYLAVLKKIYSQISPELGVSESDIVDYVTKPDKRPEYFEWVLVLGPKLAKYIDEKNVPRAYNLIKMNNGGLILHEDIFNNRASEEDMNTVLEMIPEDLPFLWENKE